MAGKFLKFDLPKNQSSIIKVIGVGGGGSNAVNHMFRQGIKGVDFVVCNTDAQSLNSSPVPNKIQLGSSLTEGLGAGGNPETGKNAAIENIEQIKEIIGNNTKMVFITAGLGGGTGTGGAPVIAATAKKLGILTVGIVTIPFYREGPKRKLQAEQGLEEMRNNVDAVIVICNDKLREMYGNLTVTNAFQQADNVLTTAAKGIAEIITVPGYINVDFEDVKTVMKNSGVAIMGSALAEGEDRAIKAVQQALASPLLNDNNIKDARYILLNITGGAKEVLLDEISEISDYVQEEAGSTANIILGVGTEESLNDSISVTIIASGFYTNTDLGFVQANQLEKIVRTLEDEPDSETVGSGQAETIASTPDTIPFLTETSEPKEKEEPADHFTPKTPDEKQDQKQVSFEFELNPKLQKQPDAEIFQKTPSYPERKPEGEVRSQDTEKDQIRSKERIMKLKELSYKLKTPSGVSDLENEPAYKRKNIELDSPPHSSESQISRYTLSEGDNEENKTEIKSNNSFLHDRVD
ncbi:MAG: cell division protein FtsZ [Bacteroidota bacterium]